MRHFLFDNGIMKHQISCQHLHSPVQIQKHILHPTFVQFFYMFLHVCYNHSKRSYIFPSEPNVTTSNLYRCSDTKFYYPFSWNMHAIRIYREPGCPEVEQSRPCTGQDHSSFCTCNTKKSHSYIYTVPDSQQSHSHRCKRRKQAFAQANKYQTVGRIFGGNFQIGNGLLGVMSCLAFPKAHLLLVSARLLLAKESLLWGAITQLFQFKLNKFSVLRGDLPLMSVRVILCALQAIAYICLNRYDHLQMFGS